MERGGARKADQACQQVRLAPGLLDRLAYQLSGGQRQRIMVAQALLLQPKLLVADEPVSMVDASLRAEILDLLIPLRHEHGISIFYIKDDLATAYRVSEELLVLRKGRVVDAGAPGAVLGAPAHPYTRLLVDCLPLRSPAIKQDWPGFAERANKESWPAARLLAALAAHEIAERDRRRLARHLAEAQLLLGKTLHSFDFDVVPMISKAHILAICAGDSWIEKGANILLIGQSDPDS